MSDNKDYLYFTGISHFRHAYAIPVEDLEKHRVHENQSLQDIAQLLLDKSVVKELSQYHIGEDIVKTEIVDTAQLLEHINNDEDNYMITWKDEAKIEYADKWYEDF